MCLRSLHRNIMEKQKHSIKHRIIMAIDSRSNTSIKISKEVGCTPSVCSDIIQYLKKKKVLSYIYNIKDKREKPLYLTAKGLKIKEALGVIWDI